MLKYFNAFILLEITYRKVNVTPVTMMKAFSTVPIIKSVFKRVIVVGGDFALRSQFKEIGRIRGKILLNFNLKLT
jgi:hypothetical protein